MKISIGSALICLIFLFQITNQASIKECIKNSFANACKSQLYQCFNTSDCSYQLHTNTQHIFLRDQDTTVPKMYFSHPLGISLHSCLNKECSIGQMDNKYPETLPADYCVMEVWDICGGDVEVAYSGKQRQDIMKCYINLCPTLVEHINQTE